MEAHVERMFEELEQLVQRIDKLQAFIAYNPLFGELPTEKQGLMQKQLIHMQRYQDVLSQRVHLEPKN